MHLGSITYHMNALRTSHDISDLASLNRKRGVRIVAHEGFTDNDVYYILQHSTFSWEDHIHCLILIFTTTLWGCWEDVIIPLAQLREMILRKVDDLHRSQEQLVQLEAESRSSVFQNLALVCTISWSIKVPSCFSFFSTCILSCFPKILFHFACCP